MSATLTLLKELDKLHGSMVQRADALDWDGLTQTWKSAEIGFVNLMKAPILSSLASNERAEARQLIKSLIEQQKLISERAAPWMEQVRPLLESFERFPLKTQKI